MIEHVVCVGCGPNALSVAIRQHQDVVPKLEAIRGEQYYDTLIDRVRGCTCIIRYTTHAV